MQLKPWYLSKTIWMNFVLSLIGILTEVANYLSTPSLIVTASGVIMVVVGGLGIVLRYFFTDTPIATPLRVAAAAQQAGPVNGAE